DSGQQQSNQDGDNRNHHQQLDEREGRTGSSRAHEGPLSEGECEVHGERKRGTRDSPRGGSGATPGGGDSFSKLLRLSLYCSYPSECWRGCPEKRGTEFAVFQRKDGPAGAAIADETLSQ